MTFFQTNLTDFLLFVWKQCFQMSNHSLKNKTKLKKDYCEDVNELFLKEILLIF